MPPLFHFASTAARKAWEALLDGRLPLSPRLWVRDLKLHWSELRQPPPPPPPGEGKAALEARCRRELEELLASGQPLRLGTSPEPELSILIVLYGRDELALRCLRSLKTSRPFEVILVDNGNSRLRVEGATVIRNPSNLGFPAAVNQAARAARGKYLLLLNHDAAPEPAAIDHALSLLGPGIGAVGARLILPDGTLQEAGSRIRGDGSCVGIGRGNLPHHARWNFQRDVDFCSAAFLLTPKEGFDFFDESYGPAYYEDVDYCVRLWKRGLRVVYDPGAVVSHYEFASSPAPAQALRMQAERRARFVAKHGDWLAQPRKRGLQIVVFDDRVPHSRLGSGFPRALSMLRALAADGHQVTLYPTIWPEDDDPYAELPRTVEVVPGSGWPGVRAFWAERGGEFDRVIVSRPNNLQMLSKRLRPWPPRHLIYDAEALFALRDGKDPRAEVQMARGARAVLTVSEVERAHFAAIAPAHVVGHALPPSPTLRPFAARQGLLFVGAFHTDDSPNSDAVRWFVRELLPEIRRQLGPISFTIAGPRLPPSIRRLDVDLREGLDELTPLYDAARLFVAPTLHAAGLPYKVHHAAAHGLPVVCTPLLQSQLGWSDEVSAGDFIPSVCKLYNDQAAWQKQRDAALRRIAADCAPERFAAALREALR